MAGFSCRGRRSGLFALSFLCHAWPAYESLPVNVLPSLHHGPTTRFSSFVRWFYRAIAFKVYRGRVPSKSKRLDAIRGTSNWPGLNENDPATLMALPLLPTPGQWRPPCCPFVHGNKIPRAGVSRLSSRAEIARGSLGQLEKPTDVTYKWSSSVITD